jgi:hypothetical protein
MVRSSSCYVNYHVQSRTRLPASKPLKNTVLLKCLQYSNILSHSSNYTGFWNDGNHISLLPNGLIFTHAQTHVSTCTLNTISQPIPGEMGSSIKSQLTNLFPTFFMKSAREFSLYVLEVQLVANLDLQQKILGTTTLIRIYTYV